MERTTPQTYGDRIAPIYDELYAELRADPAGAVNVLTELAGDRAVLELGIGTGRIAIPLAERGVRIQGIDVSEAMVAKLRAKPGGESIPVTMGDFADVPGEGSFGLVFAVFNTLFALTSQADQVRCFRNVADRLEPGGRFLFEAFVPDLARFDRDQRTATEGVGVDWVHVEHSVHRPAEQRVDAVHVVHRPDGSSLYPVEIRYAFPAELDLMAELAGLRLEHRWSDWNRAPFTDASTGHVSVWMKPA